MSSCGYMLFDTGIGRCALIWGEAGIAGVYLPERSDAVLRERIARRFPDAAPADPPPPVADAVARVQALLAGGADDLADIVLDMTGLTDFQRRVYAIGRTIGPGQTRTYGEIARELGDASAARAVGEAMGRNPFPIIMPCHRVLGADGKMGGFSAPGGVATKRRLLEIEGATSVEALPLFHGSG